MKAGWHSIWGSGQGPIRRLAPQSRILCGVLMFSACMCIPVNNVPGVSTLMGCVGLWLMVTLPPDRLVRSTLMLGLILFLPYFLLTPIVLVQGGHSGWLEAGAIPWKIFIRGLAGMQVSVATISTLTAGELRQGVLRLPLPRVVCAILVQIVQQTSALLGETRRIGQSMTVRGGTGHLLGNWRVLLALPRVWLPRVVGRAERVADAMELRGYIEDDLALMGVVPWRAPDIVAVASCVVLLAAVVLACSVPGVSWL